MSTWIILALALSIAVGLFVLKPLLESSPLVVGANNLDGDTTALIDGGNRARLLDSKERSLRALKDLELDYTMGKVSQDDFEKAKAEISLEVAKILEELRHHA